MLPSEHLIYLSSFIAPFVQEDAAVIGAVTAFAHPGMDQMADGVLIVSAMLVGLIISDLWKYWLGWAGRTQAWAHRFSEKPGVAHVRAKIVANPGKTLLIARFVPGTRIPAYIAAGFFGVPFWLFATWIVISALAYTFVAWALIVSVGTVAGVKGQLYLAIGLISAILVFVTFKMISARPKRPARVDL
jgi:membrane protein DedA with SNARE-associated domain